MLWGNLWFHDWPLLFGLIRLWNDISLGICTTWAMFWTCCSDKSMVQLDLSYAFGKGYWKDRTWQSFCQFWLGSCSEVRQGSSGYSVHVWLCIYMIALGYRYTPCNLVGSLPVLRYSVRIFLPSVSPSKSRSESELSDSKISFGWGDHRNF